MTERRILALLTLIVAPLATGCGASMTELRENHVWDRALCETSVEDAPAVRRDIEHDEQLAVAVQAVPPDAVAALGPPDDETPNADNPLDDLVLARVRRSVNAVPIESSTMRVRLLVDGDSLPRAELGFEDLLRRTGETIPPTRRVYHRGGGGGSVGPLEFFGRLLAGVVTLGLSELLIHSATSRSGGYTTTEEPSASQIAASAPYASALSVAYEELSRGGDIYVWTRPPEGATRAIELTLVHEARCQRASERATLTETLVIELDDGVPLEQAIADRFGDREHTLDELRAMASPTRAPSPRPPPRGEGES